MMRTYFSRFKLTKKISILKNRILKSSFLAITTLALGYNVCTPAIGHKNADANNALIVATDRSAPPLEQARMLLRKVQITGKVSQDLPYFDPEFERRVGQTCEISRDQFRSFLVKNFVSEWEIGGNIDLPLCSRTDGNGNVEYAKYMVIHDTSYPRVGGSFPDNINDASWTWNDLRRWNANVTHVYVNRLGESKVTTPFNEGMTATKLERYILGEGNSKGLYLHVELIQPRRALPGYGRHNDAGAPSPGFSSPQYRRLALLYMAASVRRGEWLIPAFHACVDSGIRNAHDDPQNFELAEFFAALNGLILDVDTANKNKVAGGN
jgi:hypothetical protein